MHIEKSTVNNHCRVFSSGRHWAVVFVDMLMRSGYVEKNPGPSGNITESTLRFITQNCRGIHIKLKQILNNCHKLVNNNETVVVGLQEMMIKDDQLINLSWRGNYVFTPGTGHGRGCLSLLSSTITPTVLHQLGERGHIFSIPLGKNKLIIANIYAPNGNGGTK